MDIQFFTVFTSFPISDAIAEKFRISPVRAAAAIMNCLNAVRSCTAASSLTSLSM